MYHFMMDHDVMTGVNGSTMMFFAWTTYILFTIILILVIVALWKYISKK